MNEQVPLVQACLTLTLFCGVGAIVLAVVTTVTPGEMNNSVFAVLNTLITLFGLGVSAFLFKALGG